MSYTVAPPAPKPRPGVVSAATMLLYFSALLQFVSVALTIPVLIAIQDVASRLQADEDPNVQAAGLTFVITQWATIAVGVLLGAGLAVLALFVGKGKNPARIVTWVISGLYVLCTGCGVIATAALGSFAVPQDGADPAVTEATEEIEAAIPSWTTTVGLVLSVLGLLVMLVVIVLLALPAANDFFRKETAPVWVPPGYGPPGAAGYGAAGYVAPGYGAPGYGAPGQPGAPGYGAPGQPGVGGYPPPSGYDPIPPAYTPPQEGYTPAPPAVTPPPPPPPSGTDPPSSSN